MSSAVSQVSNLDATMAIPVIGRSGGVRSIGVAIGLPDPYAGVVRQTRINAADPLAHVIPPHVTLLPPTSIPAALLPQVGDHLEEAARTAEPFIMRLCGTGTFRPVSDVVFLNVVEGADSCSALAGRINRGVLAQRLRFDYHPHVTLAHDVEESSLDYAQDALCELDVRFAVAEFALYEYAADEVWRTIRVFPLQAG